MTVYVYVLQSDKSIAQNIYLYTTIIYLWRRLWLSQTWTGRFDL